VTLTGEPSVYYPTGVRNYARVIAADDVQAIGAAILARKLGVNRVFVLDNTNEDYGVPLANEFSRVATKLGIAVVGRSSWNPGAEHYFATAREIAAKRSNGVFFGGDSGGNAVGLLSDIRATLGARPVFIAPDGFDAAGVLVAGHAADGLYLCKPGVPTNRLGQAGREFVQAFAKKYGMKPSLFAVHSAQALAVLLDAISRSDGTRASVSKALFSTRISNGILGSFWITPSGDPTLNVVAVDRIVDGRVRRAAAINVPDDLISVN
jgi:branched-chain amino acid transport system substrate-binding protein